MDRRKKNTFVGGMTKDLEQLKRVPKMNYLKTKFLCCDPELRKQNRLLEKS